METLMHADIFFFITTIAVVIFTVFCVIIGVYLIKIMKNFSQISDRLKKTVDDADDELRDISEHVRESAIFSFIFGKKKRSRTKK